MAVDIHARVDDNGLVLNGVAVQSQLLAEDYRAVLGDNYRVFNYGLPSANVDSNNKALVYDDYGLFLMQHHSTRLIRAVSFVYRPDVPPVRASGCFTGTLSLFARVIPPTPRIDDLPETLRQVFPIRGLYHLKREHIAVSAEVNEDRDVRLIEISFRK